MYFAISKLVWFLAQPSGLILLLTLAAVLLARRWPSAAHGAAASALFLLVALGMSPLAYWLGAPLEERFPRPKAAALPTIDGIIVLGGAVEASLMETRGGLLFNGAGERLTDAALLARRFPEARVIFTGGAGAFLADGPSEAIGAEQILIGLGIERARAVFEGASRTTAENASLTREMLAPGAATVPGRYLLVTSAWHMPRSVATFRAAGFDVIAWPADYRTRGDGDWTHGFVSLTDRLTIADTMVKEWVGLVVYRLTGVTQEFWPAP